MHALRLALGRNGSVLWLLLIWSAFNSVMMSALNPLALKFLIDEGVVKGNFSIFVTVGLVSLVGFTLLRLSDYFCSLKIDLFELSLAEEHTLSTYRSFEQRSDTKQLEQQPGYLVARTLSDSLTLSQKVLRVSIGLTRALSGAIASLGVIFYLSVPLSIVLLCVTPVLFYLARNFSGKIKLSNDRELESEAVLKDNLTNNLEALYTTGTLNYWSQVRHSVWQVFGRYKTDRHERFKNTSTYNVINQILLSGLELGVIIAAGYTVFLGRMTFGDSLDILMRSGQLLIALGLLCKSFLTLQSCAASRSEFKKHVHPIL